MYHLYLLRSVTITLSVFLKDPPFSPIHYWLVLPFRLMSSSALRPSFSYPLYLLFLFSVTQRAAASQAIILLTLII